MRKAKKTVLAVACAAALVAGSIAGTMAYLTSKDEVKNTFTVGQVEISLDEAKVDEKGRPVDKDGKVVKDLAAAERVTRNSYKLIPGHKYTKDPTLTVLKGSEESYVRLMVTATFDGNLTEEQLATKLDGIFTGYGSDWARKGDPAVTTEIKTVCEDGEEKVVEYTVVTYEYRYKTTVEGEVEGSAADNKLPALFTGIAVPDTWTNEDLKAIGGFSIDVEGQAIQADGFEDADAAWTAFGKQVAGAVLPPTGTSGE